MSLYVNGREVLRITVCGNFTSVLISSNHKSWYAEVYDTSDIEAEPNSTMAPYSYLYAELDYNKFLEKLYDWDGYLDDFDP